MKVNAFVFISDYTVGARIDLEPEAEARREISSNAFGLVVPSIRTS